MSAEKKSDAAAKKANSEAQAPSRNRFLSKKLMWGVVALLILQILAMGYFSYYASSEEQPGSPELTLGKFRYEGLTADESAISGAKFQLHISLLEEADRAGRGLMASHRFKVQQEVEELLRRAHARDFDDPSLAELKRQLQEAINRTVGKRIISEVIITDLALERVASAEGDMVPSLPPSPAAPTMPAKASDKKGI